MLFGACYYPEHWQRERWETDFRLMRDARFNVVRMAEFAWAKMEPEEGVFDFTWLDEAVRMAEQHGMEVILGTPTAGPPAWLMEKYPDIYPRDFQGLVRGFGTRRHYCFNNPSFHRYTEIIVRAMAARYGRDANVIAWQVDNEFGAIQTTRCYCEHCLTAFQGWLKARYGTLEALNEAWGTMFSSQTFQRWEHVHLPIKSVHQGHNPGLVLDFNRFASDSVCRYQRLQVEILREACPEQLVTTNLMGSYNEMNYFDLSEDLDVVSLDIYPIMKREPNERAFRTGINLDMTRGFKRRNYWVLEMQSGTPGGGVMVQTPKPGELRRWTYQTIARGADAVVYFRWRTITFGLEQFWHGILQHHGMPGRTYDEVAVVGEELARLAPVLEGTELRARCAIVRSYDNEWAFEIQAHARGYTYKEHFASYYRYFHERNIQVDVISPEMSFDGYDLVVVPNLMMAREDTVRHVHEYVQAGGCIVMDFRAGAKLWDNRMRAEKLPGPYRELLGIEIEDYGVIFPDEPVGVELGGEPHAAHTWYDVVEATTAETVASYTEDYFAGAPAVTNNRYGSGTAYYLASELEHEALGKLLDGICRDRGVEPVLAGMPPGVETVCREREGERLVFVINHEDEAVTVPIPEPCEDVLSGRSWSQAAEVVLERNGVMVLRMDK